MTELKSFIEEQLSIWEVPGCAVAAVKEGEVVIAQGFGLRDVGAGLPVSADTLFPIGSTTKSFTAAAVGTLVDDGIVEWETPVRKYLPNFQMHDPVATERLTPRDLLAHASGLPRHEFVWLGHHERTRADLVSRLRYLPLSKDIRQEFQYCNLGYLTVGALIDLVSDMSWEQYLQMRLLKPLGMDRTNTSVEQTLRDDDFSKPYEKRNGSVVEIPHRVIENIGPAGSINSSVSEMLSWLRMNLSSNGEEEQIVARSTLQYIHSPQTLLTETELFPEQSAFAYGLGWVVGRYRGHRHVHHNGGIDGFLTECMMLPEQGIGVVVLSNRLIPFANVVALRVLDELLEVEPADWDGRIKEQFDAAQKGSSEARAAAPRVEGAKLLRNLDEYAGEFTHPGYGTFTVAVDDGVLTPTFGTLQLELSHRHFDVFDLEWSELTDQLIVWPLTFLTGPEGDVTGLTILFESSVEAIHFGREPDAAASDPKLLESLTGTYEMGPIELKVELKGEATLTVATSGGPPTDLIPSRGLRFGIKDAPAVTIEFVVDESQSVEKVIVQPGGVFTPKSRET